jgi:hypothetical protein
MSGTVPSLRRLALLGFALFLVGCGLGSSEIRYPETGATLEGTVTYNKEKVTAALIIAQNASGSAQAFVDESGHYKLENVPLGEVTLGVNTEAGKGQAMGRIMAQSQGKAKGAPKMIDVPKTYADPAASGIKTTIKAGPNEYDIAISPR